MAEHLRCYAGELLLVGTAQLHATVVPVGSPTANLMAKEHHLQLVQALCQGNLLVVACEVLHLALVVDEQLTINPNLLQL